MIAQYLSLSIAEIQSPENYSAAKILLVTVMAHVQQEWANWIVGFRASSTIWIICGDRMHRYIKLKWVYYRRLAG
jgi:hypothetical protein